MFAVAFATATVGLFTALHKPKDDDVKRARRWDDAPTVRTGLVRRFPERTHVAIKIVASAIVVVAPVSSMRSVVGLLGHELFQFATGTTPATAVPVTVPLRS